MQESERELGAVRLAPGPRSLPLASRWGSCCRRRQPRPAPKPRPLRPGRGRREGAGPRRASSTLLINLPAPLRSGRPQTRVSRSNTRGPPRRSRLSESPAPGGNEGAVEGALLLGHYLEKRDRPALLPAHPLSRPGPRATPPEGKLSVSPPLTALPPPYFSLQSFLRSGRRDEGGRGSSQPPSSPSHCLTFPRLPSIPCAPQPLWSGAPN